ncbi:DUF3999 family protein [Dokdonella sp.]|uniref:DUF3999 family protein n=1 Tax=Dokdonella sp. TaxID=2291710 RepID=UPI003527165A
MKQWMLVAGLLVQSAAASTPDDYAIVIPIESLAESAAMQVELDRSVYQGSIDPGLRDMAIFNADGRSVPMMIWPLEIPDTLSEERSPVPVLPLPGKRHDDKASDLGLVVERDATGRLLRLETQTRGQQQVGENPREWLVDLSNFEEEVDDLELDWDEPADNLIARLEISASNDLQSWKLLNAGANLVSLESGGERIERSSIDLPSTRSRYLRLRRTDDGAPIVGLRATASRYRKVAGIPKLQWIEAQTVERIGDLDATSTRFLYSFFYAAPVSTAMISLASDNALARIAILTAKAGEPDSIRWTPRARAVAFGLREGNEEISVDRVWLSGGDPRVAWLRIDSETPLAAPPHVSVGFRAARVLFLAEGRGPYLLAVGSATEHFPDYPVEAALTSLRSRYGKDWQPPIATLGDMRMSAGPRALQPPERPTDWKNWLLWSVLIGAALVVGGIALSLLRGTGQRSTEDRQQPPEE